YLLDADRRTLERVGFTGLGPDNPVAPATVQLDGRSPWPFAEALAGGQLVQVSGPSLPANLPTGVWSEPPSRVALLPIAGSGEGGQAAVLVAGLNPYRLVDAGVSAFLSLVGGQIGAAIANARGYEEERRRTEALAELDRAKTVFFSNVSHEFR